MTAQASIRIGTRASLLARTQTGWVAESITRIGHAVTIETVTTTSYCEITNNIVNICNRSGNLEYVNTSTTCHGISTSTTDQCISSSTTVQLVSTIFRS